MFLNYFLFNNFFFKNNFNKLFFLNYNSKTYINTKYSYHVLQKEYKAWFIVRANILDRAARLNGTYYTAFGAPSDQR